MTTVQKYTSAGAASFEVARRADLYVDEHQGSTYREAVHAVLSADKQLAEAYAQPAPRRVRMATTDKRSQPAVQISPAEESEIADWIQRAVRDNKASSLPGALGGLAAEANLFAKLGMPVEEATRRAMGLFPHLVSMAKLLLADVRRNAPELVPTGEDKPVAQQAQGSSAGYVVHARAVKLQQEHPHMDYREAVGAVLSEDTQLKVKYAGVK
jgi:hypothetical protein